MAYTYEQVMAALRAAHEAGQEDDARRLAQMAVEMKGQKEPEKEGFFSQLGKNALGELEAAGSLGSGMTGIALGLVPAGLGAINDMAHGQPADFENKYARAIDALTYKPQTERGKDYAETTGEFINRNVVPLGPMMGTLAPVATAMRAGAMARRAAKAKVADTQGMMADIAGETPSKAAVDRPPTAMPVTPEGQGVNPGDMFWKQRADAMAAAQRATGREAMRQPNDPFGQMKQQLNTPQQLPMDLNPSPVIDQMVNNLTGQREPKQLELPLEEPQQRPQFQLQGEQMDLPTQPKAEPQPFRPIQGQQQEMFGNPELFDLKSEGELGKRPAPNTPEQLELGLGERPKDLELEAPEGTTEKPPVGMLDGQSELFPKDLFDLEQDKSSFPKLPENSLYEQAQAEARAAALAKAVAEDPKVMKAEERLQKAQELYTKVAGDFQEGRVSQAHLTRVERDLAGFEDALDFLKKEAVKRIQMGERKAGEPPFVPLKQRGSVDITPLRRAVDFAIEKLKSIDNPLVKSAIEKFTTTEDPRTFATARAEAKAQGMPFDTLKALDDAYMAATKRKLGDASNRAGLGPIGPGKKQAGFILMESKKLKAAKNLVKVADQEKVLGEAKPSMWSLEQAKEIVKKADDLKHNVMQKAINYGTKGGQYMAMKTHNPVIRYVVERFLSADRLARADIRDWLHTKESGLGPLIRDLNPREQAEAWSIINFADLHQKSIDLSRMAERGFNAAQIKLVEAHRKAMDYALEQVNRARRNAGLDEITPRTAYAAMSASGDFRSLVYDQKGGNIVGVIGSNFRPRLNKLRAQMEAKGYYVDSEKYFGGGPKNRGSADEAFSRALEQFSNEDPRVAEFIDVLNQIRTSEINNFLNMKKHTMPKKGIFGMEGRKEWVDAVQNAQDGFRSQMNYLESAIKWGHLSEAFKESSELLKSEEAAHMKEAKKYAERYMYNALGFNPSEVGRAAENFVATVFDKMGVGYSAGRKAMAGARYFTNSMLLTLRPSFWAQNVVQPLVAMPGMKADLLARGLDAGFDFGTGYAYVAQGANTSVRIKAGVKGLSEFEKAAGEYAKRNHVYGSDMVEHSNRVTRGAGYYIDSINNVFAGNVESATRQVMFHAFAHMLHENGMPVKNGLFETAHNLTDMAMNNYSSMERPQMYNSMGPLGDLAVNLQSFKHNEMSRIAMFVRDSKELKDIRPIAADMMSRLAYGGVLGLVAYEEADAIFRFVTKMMGKPQSLTNLVFDASEAHPGPGGNKYLLSNGLPSYLGLDMSRSLGLTDVVPDSVGAAFFPGGSKIAEGVSSAAHLIPGMGEGAGPTEMNAKRAAYANAPVAAQGYLNNKFFTRGEGDQREALRPSDLKSQAHRNDSDYMKKNFGFTGMEESQERQKNYNVERMNRDYADLRQTPLSHMRDSLFSKGQIDPKDLDAYFDARGNPKTLEGDLKRYEKEQALTPRELAYLRSQTSSAIGARQKALDYMKAFKK